jgi:hypothetical protein
MGARSAEEANDLDDERGLLLSATSLGLRVIPFLLAGAVDSIERVSEAYANNVWHSHYVFEGDDTKHKNKTSRQLFGSGSKLTTN